jgi:hypothetical protein
MLGFTMPRPENKLLEMLVSLFLLTAIFISLSAIVNRAYGQAIMTLPQIYPYGRALDVHGWAHACRHLADQTGRDTNNPALAQRTYYDCWNAAPLDQPAPLLVPPHRTYYQVGRPPLPAPPMVGPIPPPPYALAPPEFPIK